MLSYAYHTLQQQDAILIESEPFDHIYDLYAAILGKGISNQIRKGLIKEYKEQTEELSRLRGRIDIANTIYGCTFQNRRCLCIYDECSENSYMNQILKSVVCKLIEKEEVKKENKIVLKKILYRFSNIDNIKLASIDWSSLQYHKNNASYQMLMNICYLCIQQMLLTTKEGEKKMPSFLDEQQMHRLYEKFILEYYKKWFPEYKPSSKKITWAVEGEKEFLPMMQSDITLTDGQQYLIIDAKYYTRIFQERYQNQTIHSNNMYQIFTYVKNQDKYQTGNVSGLLLYAKVEDEIEIEMDYNIGGNRIGVMTLDLGVEFYKIRKQLDSIVQLYFYPKEK